MCLTRTLVFGCCFALAVGGVMPAVAQETVDPIVKKLDERMGQFLEQVSTKFVAEAYTDLLKGGHLATRAADVTALTEKTEQIQELYGDYLAFDRVYARRVGNDLVFLKYLYKCRYVPVLWHVTFYRAPERNETGPSSGNNWHVVAIRFDTNLEVLTLLQE